MEAHDSYTRLLGLALRGGNLPVGGDAVRNAVHMKTARLLLLSADAAERTRREAARLADEGQCLCLTLPCGREELGRALGRGEVSLAALTDTGLAAALGGKLALLDPERYGTAAERLNLKVKRAKERRNARAVRRDAKPKGGGRAASPARNGTTDGKPRPRRTAARDRRPSGRGRPPNRGGNPRPTGPKRRSREAGKIPPES